MALLLLLMLPCHPGGFQCSSLKGRLLHPGAFLTKPVSLREAFYKLKTTTLLLRDLDPMDGLDKSYLTITGSKTIGYTLDAYFHVGYGTTVLCNTTHTQLKMTDILMWTTASVASDWHWLSCRSLAACSRVCVCM